MTRRCGVVLAAGLLSAIAVTGAVRPDGGASPASQSIEPARFVDPDRRAKLAGAMPEIDRLFRAFAERSRVPGIAYGVLIDGDLVHTGAAGVRNVATGAPVDVDTVLRIASMTKSFTAMAILKLRDEGRLALDDPAERYVPELKGLSYPAADSPRITIRHLLSHAEGFPEDNPWGDQQLDATDEEMSEMMRRGIPFSNTPGVAYEYSNFGFAILGRIVSRVSGMPYRDYVAATILSPLGMTATTLEPGRVPPGRLAHGYRWEDETWKEEPPLADGAFGAMGGMLTSIRDLGQYVGFLMSTWPPRDDPETGPIRRASAREMQQVWRPAPATVTRAATDGATRLNTGGYGFGLRVWQTCDFRQIVAHSGGLPGFGSHMRWLPDYGVGVIAVGNLTLRAGPESSTRPSPRSSERAASRRACRSRPRRSSRPATACRDSSDSGTIGSPTTSRPRISSWISRRIVVAARSKRCAPRWANASPMAPSTSRTRCAASGR